MTPWIASPGDTWSGVLLDGLVAGLVGAFATIVVVGLTIRHDSRARIADRLDDAAGTALAALSDFGTSMAIHGLNDPRSLALQVPAIRAFSMFATRAQRLEPELADLLREAANDLTRATNALTPQPTTHDEVQASVHRMVLTVTFWMADPDGIRCGLMPYSEIRTAQMRTDSTGTIRDWKAPKTTRRQRIRRRLPPWLRK